MKYVYYSENGSISLSDIDGILQHLGYRIDSDGRDSSLGPNGRYIIVMPWVSDKEKRLSNSAIDDLIASQVAPIPFDNMGKLDAALLLLGEIAKRQR